MKWTLAPFATAFAVAVGIATVQPLLVTAVPTCFIVGDSIAYGTATAESLPASYRIDACQVDAKIGIPSSAIVARAHNAALLVVSAGSNDPRNPALVTNLEKIRAVAQHKVLWIVPAVSPVAAAAVRKVAAEHGDEVVTFIAGGDHTHPKSYAPLIEAVRKDLNQ